MPPPKLADWVRPLEEATRPALAGIPAPVAVDALLAIGAAYGHVSAQTEQEFIQWARECWDRCFNIMGQDVIPSPKPYAYPTVLSGESEAAADAWLQLLMDRKERWAQFGSAWAKVIKTSQVAAVAMLVAARCCQRTHTSYSQWTEQVRVAWQHNHLALEAVPPPDADTPASPS